jgi:hypothetical protein
VVVLEKCGVYFVEGREIEKYNMNGVGLGVARVLVNLESTNHFLQHIKKNFYININIDPSNNTDHTQFTSQTKSPTTSQSLQFDLNSQTEDR